MSDLTEFDPGEELRLVLLSIDEQIDVQRDWFKENMLPPANWRQARTSNGEYIFSQLLVARAQVLCAIAALPKTMTSHLDIYAVPSSKETEYNPNEEGRAVIDHVYSRTGLHYSTVMNLMMEGWRFRESGNGLSMGFEKS